MQARRTWLFATRGVVAAAGLMFLLALQPEPAGITSDRFDSHARALILSDQARRYLTLQYRSYPTEFMGCMIGEIHGNAVIVRRIAPADVEPGHSTATRAVPEQTCEGAECPARGHGSVVRQRSPRLRRDDRGEGMPGLQRERLDRVVPPGGGPGRAPDGPHPMRRQPVVRKGDASQGGEAPDALSTARR